MLEKEIAYNVLFTKYQHHATRLVHDLTSDGAPHTIVVLGGDGTLNEVIDGIRYLDKVTLGYIPLGSGNDFARGLGLPTDIHSALEQILSPSHYTAMNVGVLDYENKHRRFAVSTGIGFDAAVCHQVMVTVIAEKIQFITIIWFAKGSAHCCGDVTEFPFKSRIDLLKSRSLEIGFWKMYFPGFQNLFGK